MKSGTFKSDISGTFVSDTSGTFGVIYSHKGNKVVAEIKVRDIKYKDYSTHLMELDKFMNMTKAKIDNDCALGMYFNFFGDDDLYIYNISDINTIECEVISL